MRSSRIFSVVILVSVSGAPARAERLMVRPDTYQPMPVEIVHEGDGKTVSDDRNSADSGSAATSAGASGAVKPPLESAQSSQAMPAQVSGFNAANAALVADRLMDFEARMALQNQVNRLAEKYDQLQKDMRSGKYDTSRAGQELAGLGKSVDDVKMPTAPDPRNRSDVTAKANDESLTAADQNRGAAGNTGEGAQHATVEAKPSYADSENFAPVAAPNAPALPANRAGASEQIVPVGSLAALSGADLAPAKPSADGAELSGSGARGRDATVIRSLAGAGESKDSDFRFRAPDGAEGLHRHAASASAGYADGTAGDAGKATALAEAGSRSPGANAPLRLAPAGNPAAGKAKAKENGAPRGLLDSVERVQGSNAEPESKVGFFGEIQRAVFGLSFFKPLDFPRDREVSEASFAPDSADGWWQALALPIVCTLLVAGVFWIFSTRKRQRN